MRVGRAEKIRVLLPRCLAVSLKSEKAQIEREQTARATPTTRNLCAFSANGASCAEYNAARLIT